ncbi:MAG: hypothetical protein HY276_07715 [Ignavibacteriales bacterium]|nr:hypothetical protein [Ignavibacteriales bacterium]
MDDYILILFAVAILYLGVRIVLKVREMNAYSDNDEKIAKLPKELHSLNINEPSENFEADDTSNETENTKSKEKS